MTQVLLTSEEFVKGLCNIDQNVAGKFLSSALTEAQEIELREVVGDCLLEALKNYVRANSEDNVPIPEPYQELLEKIQYVLAYRAIASLCMMVNYKLANAGTVTTRDDNMDVVSFSDLTSVREYYTHKGDFYTRLLQNFLLQNRSDYPELRCCDCDRIKANLRSSASTGLWLGGARAYKLIPTNLK